MIASSDMIAPTACVRQRIAADADVCVQTPSLDLPLSSLLPASTPPLAGSFIVNAKHERLRTLTIHIEKLLDYVHDKFHRRELIVQEQYTPF
jgi:hypothetical protein